MRTTVSFVSESREPSWALRLVRSFSRAWARAWAAAARTQGSGSWIPGLEQREILRGIAMAEEEDGAGAPGGISGVHERGDNGRFLRAIPGQRPRRLAVVAGVIGDDELERDFEVGSGSGFDGGAEPRRIEQIAGDLGLDVRGVGGGGGEGENAGRAADAVEGRSRTRPGEFGEDEFDDAGLGEPLQRFQVGSLQAVHEQG